MQNSNVCILGYPVLVLPQKSFNAVTHVKLLWRLSATSMKVSNTVSTY